MTKLSNSVNTKAATPLTWSVRIACWAVRLMILFSLAEVSILGFQASGLVLSGHTYLPRNLFELILQLSFMSFLSEWILTNPVWPQLYFIFVTPWYFSSGVQIAIKSIQSHSLAGPIQFAHLLCLFVAVVFVTSINIEKVVSQYKGKLS